MLGSALNTVNDKIATRAALIAISFRFDFAMIVTTCKKLLITIIVLYKVSTKRLVAYIELFTSEKFNWTENNGFEVTRCRVNDN